MGKAVEIVDKEPYRDAFDEQADQRKGEPERLRKAREAALARFLAHGFPHAKLEAWKKTNLRRLAAAAHAPAGAPDPRDLETVAPAVDALRLPDTAGCLVFVDGHHVASLSSPVAQDGVDAVPLRETLRSEEPPVGRLAPGDGPDPGSDPSALGTGPEWALAELNLALFADGLHLRVAAGTIVERPLQAIHLSTQGQGVLASPRHLVELGPAAQAGLVETYAGLDASATWTNAVLEARLAEGARLARVKVQREPLGASHIGLSAARLEKDAHMEDLSFSLGAGLSRHDIHAALVGEGAHVALNGVFLGRKEQHVDHRTTIVHAVASTTSREFYKGVMDDAGHGVFTGKIVVAPGAQHTDADQQNKNLILSRKGLVDSTPQLEIHADDVKCSHGSAIGQISPDQLFYMQTRGVPRERARLILTQAFAHEPLEIVQDKALRRHLADLVTAWFLTGNPDALADVPRDDLPPGGLQDPLRIPPAPAPTDPGAPSKKGMNQEPIGADQG